MKEAARRRPLDQVGGDLLSREVALRVPSARAGLTSLFGMGRGVPPPLSPPKLSGALYAQPSKLHSDSTYSKSRPRAISTGPLNALLRLHVPPINVVVSHGPYSLEGDGKPHLEVGFPLRCFQRLSHPDVANQQRRWHDD